MNLEERIKRLEKEDEPRKIRSWLDLAKYIEQGKGEKIEFEGVWKEYVEEVMQKLKRSNNL